jgi:hypothetical protein
MGSEATYGSPAVPDRGPVGQMLRGAELAREEVSGTTGVLIWPAEMAWVGPETVTSLIEAHGMDPATVLRPAWHGESGWPVLVPLSALHDLGGAAPDRQPPDVIDDLVGRTPSRSIELGDPGVRFDAETAFDDLPAYEGPLDPPAGHVHEWGDDISRRGGVDDVPGEGRGLAPFPQVDDDIDEG